MNADSEKQLIDSILLRKDIKVQGKRQESIELVLKEHSAGLRNSKEINHWSVCVFWRRV